MSSQSLSRTAARGAVVTVGGQIAKLVLQLASVVVLSRLLSPHDYGLVAIVLVIIAFGETFRDFGLSSASVQAKTLTPKQRSNLFWTNTGIGVVLAIAVFCASWPLAAVTKEPGVIPITQVLSLSFLINGLMSQYRASLLRNLRFRALAIIDVLAGATALAVAITLALLGFGFWALVAQQLVQLGFGLVGTAVAARWLPGLPNREGDIRPMVKFGWALVGSQLIAYASANIDTLIVGIRFGTVSLGFYNRAFQLVMTPVNQIRGPMTTVALPVLSRIQETKERFNEYVVVGQLGLSYPICLALGAGAVFAEPVTLVALGPQWGETAPLLRLLAISAMFQTLAFVGYWVYVSRGLGRELFKYSMLSAAIRITCIVVGSQWGVIGVALGFMIGPAINWPISIGWLSRVTDVPTRRLYLGAGRVLLLVAASGGISAGAMALIPPLAAPLAILVGFVIYVAVVAAALLVPWYRRDARTLMGLAKIVRNPRAEPPAMPPSTIVE